MIKKSHAYIVAVIFLAIGVLAEYQWGFLGKSSEDVIIEDPVSLVENEKPVWGDPFSIVDITSPMDEHVQKAYFYKSKSMSPQPLIVSLHTWSHDYTQFDSINLFSVGKDYNYIHPNFRGTNTHKDACCGKLVISDIDAAIDYALENANVDPSAIYVIGMSGGGYATLAMFMKSKHNIKKFSSWVPLVDLVRWYDETKIRELKYAAEILACTESIGENLNVAIAKEKSPIYWTTPVEKLASSKLSIFAGVYDGMENKGTIPITHSINFYNKILKSIGESEIENFVSDEEKLELLEFRKPLGVFDDISDRKVILKKVSNNVSLTLFEGGHEILERFAFRDLIE